jgi:hypothetical protein
MAARASRSAASLLPACMRAFAAAMCRFPSERNRPTSPDVYAHLKSESGPASLPSTGASRASMRMPSEGLLLLRFRFLFLLNPNLAPI